MTNQPARSAEAAHLRLDGHERECAVRYAGIQDAVGELKSDMRLMLKGLAAALIALVGWLAVQVYVGLKTQVQPAERHQPVNSGSGD